MCKSVSDLTRNTLKDHVGGHYWEFSSLWNLYVLQMGVCVCVYNFKLQTPFAPVLYFAILIALGKHVSVYFFACPAHPFQLFFYYQKRPIKKIPPDLHARQLSLKIHSCLFVWGFFMKSKHFILLKYSPKD